MSLLSLKYFATLVEKADWRIPIIMVVQGVTISGFIVSRKKYFEWMSAGLGETHAETELDKFVIENSLAAAADAFSSAERNSDICLQDAQVLYAAQELPTRFKYLIVNSSQVGAFTIGQRDGLPD